MSWMGFLIMFQKMYRAHNISVCVNVRRGYDGRTLKLDMINLNSSSSWFHSDELEEQDGTQTVIPRHELMNIVSITQLEKDTILVAYDSESSQSSLL